MPKRYNAPDDVPQYIVKRDLSGGINSRQHEQIIGDTQAVLLQNILLETAGSRQIRAGQTRLDSSYPTVAGSGYGLLGFDPDGGTFELLAVQGTNLSGCPVGGTFSTYKSDLTPSLQTTIIKAGQLTQNDIAIVSNGVDNAFAMYQDHSMHDLGDTNTSPPKTPAMAYYGNRVWTLDKNLASFSDAFPADYSLAFDRTTNAFRVPVGERRAIVSTRDQGLIFFGADQIWQLSPSVVPDPTTDFPQKVLDIGCVAGNTAVQVGDDILFLSPDGVRGLFRTALDKLQTGQSFPLSYLLQDQFNAINWSHIDKACAVYFDNKYILALPVNNAAYNNICWVYYPAMKAWVVYTGWNIARFSKIRVGGQETLYGIDSVTGQVHKLFDGTNDSGNAIEFDEISRAEDYGNPLVYKYGGEYKIKAKGGNGTLTIEVNVDGNGWVRIGTLELAVVGITFPTAFPMLFNNNQEVYGIWHLDGNDVVKFKRVKFRNYCDDVDANITILESISTAFVEGYLSE